MSFLSVIFDYFTFTVRTEKVEDVFEMLGIVPERFQYVDKGRNHYTGTYDINGICIISFCEMSLDMRVKYGVRSDKNAIEASIRLTGQAIRGYNVLSYKYDNAFDMLLDLREDDRLYCPVNYTRVDFSKDEKEGLIDLDVLEKKLALDEYVSRLSHSIISSDKERGDTRYKGKTIYIGKKNTGSKFFIRIYNKSAEIYAKEKVNSAILDEHNIRVEMVFKNSETANRLMEMVFEAYDNDVPLGKVFCGVLRSKFYLLEDGRKPSNNSEENARHIQGEWLQFIENTERMELGVVEKFSTIESKIEYFEKLNKMVSEIYYSMGDDEFRQLLSDMIFEGSKKIDFMDVENINIYREKKKMPLLAAEAFSDDL